jgi:hypothetical protein
MRGLRLICCCFLLAMFGAGSVFSQAVSSTIVGTVTDASGAAVPNAKVTITEMNTGVVHAITANGSGNYTLVDIPPGRYQVAVEMTGFKKEIKENIDVVVDSTARIDMQLQPGAVTETVEVSATAAVLKTDRADITTTIPQVAVDDLPIGMNRNFQNLLTLVPGTTDPTEQHSQFFNASSSLQMNTNGSFRMANNYQIEGVDNNERTGLLQILITPADSIQQIDISTGNHDLELGRGAGAVTNVQIKSGTNQYHGGASEYLQNSDMDARLFFNKSVGHVAYNQVNGFLGGPIKKNKLFFFGLYQRTMDHEANTNTDTIPTLVQRTGNYSAAANPGLTLDTVYDPQTGDPVTGAGRTPFPNNIIPTNRINPVSAAILNVVPGPSQPAAVAAGSGTPTNDYFALLPFQKTTDHLDSKVDWQVDDKDRFSVRFSFEKPVIYQAPLFGTYGGDDSSGGFEGTGVQRTFSTGISWDRTFTPTLIGQFRFGVAYYNNIATQTDYGKNDSTSLGILGVNINPFTTGTALVDINDFSSPLIGYSASLPWARAEANIDFVNTWTKLHGNHTFKFGVDIRRIRDALLQDQTFGPRGVFDFTNGDTVANCTLSSAGACTYSAVNAANYMAQFLLDLPNEVGRDVNTYFPALRATQVFAFGGDQWRVSNKLTLDLGLRWEFYPPFTPQFAGGFSNYLPQNNTLVLGGVGGIPENLGVKTVYHYFAPRIGAAYRLTDKTVIRAGLGISYTSFPDNTYAYNFPVRSNNEYLSAGGPYQNSTPVIYPSGQTATWQTGVPAPDPVVVPANGIITNPSNTQANFYIAPNFKNPYVIQWNFAVQRQLPAGWSLDAAYVGSHGLNTITQFNMNAGFIVGAGAIGQPEYLSYNRQVATTEFWQGFSSTFHSLQAKVNRRFANGFFMTNSFTWQKAMGFNSDDGGPTDFYINYPRNYARVSFDRTLNLVQSLRYELPWGPGKALLTNGIAGKVLGGWMVTGIITSRTGQPLNFTTSGTSVNAPGNNQTPNQIAPIQILHGINVGNQWFSGTAQGAAVGTGASFAEPATNVWGTMGAFGSTSGPGEFRIDAGLTRIFMYRERYSLQFRAEALNLTNTPIFSNPNTQENSGNFGYITGTVSSGTGVNGWNTTGRALQMSVKIKW